MLLPPLNFLTVEILTILYTMVLFYNNIYPIIMLLISFLHGIRFTRYYKEINKELISNLVIAMLYLFLIIANFALYNANSFVLFGILFGLLQYQTYFWHEKKQQYQTKWIDFKIDIPITLFGIFISYQGYKTNNHLLTPFLGDLLYHFFEFYNNLQ